MNKAIDILRFCVAFVPLLASCSLAPIAGGSDDHGNAVICGKIVDTGGIAVANAIVRLIPQTFEPIGIQSADSLPADSTDDGGRYEFVDVDSGVYNISSCNRIDGTSALRFDIYTGRDTVPLTDTLRTPGCLVIRMPANADLRNGVLYVPGTTIALRLSDEPDTAAKFVVLDSIPACLLPQIVYAVEGDTTSATSLSKNVSILSADTVDLRGAATTFYVSLGGNDSNTGTIDRPFATITAVLRFLQPLDTLFIRGGTYNQYLDLVDSIPRGTSWDSAITFAAYPGETVIMQPDGASFSHVIRLDNPQCEYLIFDGIILDGRNISSSCFYSGLGANHNRLIGCEVANARGGGIDIAEGALPLPSDSNRFIGLDVHHCGDSATAAIRIASRSTIVENCRIHDNMRAGVFLFDGASFRSQNNIVRYCEFFGNGTDSSMGGAIELAATISSTMIHHNIIRDNSYGVFMGCDSPESTFVYNNTFFGNLFFPILLGDTSGMQICRQTTTANNIIFGNGADSIADAYSTGTVAGNNLFIDPLFVDTAANDFHLLAASPAIDCGIDVDSIRGIDVDMTRDYEGKSLPRGGGFDIGALEY